MTNLLLTQTTRVDFRAAVHRRRGGGTSPTGATTTPPSTTHTSLAVLRSEAEANYNAEAALWQIGKVTTPTHIVAGADDIRVFIGEDCLLERVFSIRHFPTGLLVFPGEGHGLTKSPWHGKIKVREEPKWLEKYGGSGR
jgi:dipeptidyl aminopeptidase/acylaminoacyl peptidase